MMHRKGGAQPPLLLPGDKAGAVDKREKREILHTYFHYLIPTIIGMVAHSCYCLADVFFVGVGVGEDGLAALNVALPIFTVYTTFSVLIGVGAATAIAVCRGEGRREGENTVFTQAVLLVAAGLR